MVFPSPSIPVDARVPEETKVLCPICQNSYVHIERVSYVADGQEPNGVQILGHTLRLNCPVPSEGRGERIFIEFWGECDHRFGLLIQHHKGETFLHRIDTPVVKAGGS
jgi:hypothetical protein